MEDYCSGHISTSEAGKLIEALKPTLMRNPGIGVYRGVEYRHLMVIHRFDNKDLKTTPPHDIIGERIDPFLPNDALLKGMIFASMEVLKDHPVNMARRKLGKRAATAVWPWGEGKGLRVPTLKEEFGLTGAMISAVDLLKGLGKLRGMEVINVPGATGWIDTNYAGKAQAALDALAKLDMVYIHIEAPDEAGHGGLVKEKIKAIEDIDEKVLGFILARMEAKSSPFRILCMPDHPTPIVKRTHTSEPVPFLLFDSTQQAKHVRRFTEKDASATGLFIAEGHTLLQKVLRGENL
jgi:2,3-bisphosphoglycerate-independent phosphoglycerate mutase